MDKHDYVLVINTPTYLRTSRKSRAQKIPMYMPAIAIMMRIMSYRTCAVRHTLSSAACHLPDDACTCLVLFSCSLGSCDFYSLLLLHVYSQINSINSNWNGSKFTVCCCGTNRTIRPNIPVNFHFTWRQTKCRFYAFPFNSIDMWECALIRRSLHFVFFQFGSVDVCVFVAHSVRSTESGNKFDTCWLVTVTQIRVTS